MGYSNWFLLSRLRKAIKKVKFLLTLNVIKSRLSALRSLKSLSSSSSFSSWQQQLSFRDAPGLISGAVDDRQGSEMGSPVVITRTRSDAGGDVDINNKADDFIANFYRRLQMERQVSLEIRYLDNRLERTSSDQ